MHQHASFVPWTGNATTAAQGMVAGDSRRQPAALGRTLQPMKVMLASAEYFPLTKVGGLGVAVAGLVDELRRQGLEVDVVLPDYAAAPLADETVEALTVAPFAAPAKARTGVHTLIGPVTLVSTAGIAKPHPYVQPDGHGWPDNDQRFLGFAAAVGALAARRNPDVLHLNDWHSAAALAFLPTPPPTVFTVHTLGYQGRTAPGWLTDFQVHRDAYEHEGDTNPMAGALRLANTVITVSPNYAAEICTPAVGNGLDALLRARGNDLVGIRNGIDTAVWNPLNDPALVVPFSASQPSGKAANRAALLRELGFPDDTRPLAVSVGRLVDQKGFDLLVPIIPLLRGLGARLAILGSGDRDIVEQLTALAASHSDDFVFHNGYDEALAHRLTAGGDLFVMPSRFEPCGLAQMQAMRYGTIPVVTDVGGLHDTVTDADQHLNAHTDRGTGFVAAGVDTMHLVDALHRAVRACGDPIRRRAIQQRGMETDWSWRKPAADHIAIYRRLSAPATKRNTL
jgi:starch synthase